MWRMWCYALGKKEGRDKKDADRIAIIRTLIMVQLIITNFFIIAGNVKNLWGQTPNWHTHSPNVEKLPI